ncbi:tripartite tricarboxylate transporter substrate binding protein [Allopusillimonas soli]|uniref:Tripartite tricarboxylate transporter substrate binding protein n=1 Tax=Allopusillimonas soli TaxID=659016 RepID=A0A853F6T5_9BURK|nr:tripartite tricarboxylate transporter substrate binding protein [Allopusillimonas soli]NYT35242.1 tripartite tricarboxylate transporter substrate binding protein [Allopusillimonas soli]TEA75671.1 tripartite tricarboxylate transporter substrate binding protein [Allopusillimonas soli]
MRFLKHAVLLSTLAYVAYVPASYAADDYPSQSIRMIVPYTPGGGADTLGRLVADKMAEDLGQAIVVENKPGANTMLATDYVAGQKNDGYTLLYASSSFTINPHVYKTQYNPETSFEPVAILSEIPLVMITYKDSPLKSVSDLLAAAKAKPGAISFGSYGAGSAAHLGGALFETLSGVKLLHVPYKGSAPAVNDLLGKHVDIAIVSLTAALPLMKAGELRALGIFDGERLKSLPDVPTVSETVPHCVTVGWNGILAPKGTSSAVIKRVNKAANYALTTPLLVEHFAGQGLEPKPRTPEAFAKIIHDDNERWERVVKEAQIKLQ